MNKNSKVVVWAVVAIAVVAIGWMMFSPKTGGATVENVDAARMAELAASGVTVLDVRTAGEYEAGHIPGALNIPVDQVAGSLAALDPSQPVAVYCATGSRSVAAVTTLEQAGFTKIYHFNEGMIAWAGDVERGAVAAAPPAADEAPMDSPVLYEFYTDWCPSCKTMKPVVDGLKQEYEGTVEFRLINTDTDPNAQALAAKYGISAVPTFVFLNADGSEAGRLLGEQPEDTMRQRLDALK